MKTLIDIITGIAVVFIVISFWIFVIKKIRQYTGRPERDEAWKE